MQVADNSACRRSRCATLRSLSGGLRTRAFEVIPSLFAYASADDQPDQDSRPHRASDEGLQGLLGPRQGAALDDLNLTIQRGEVFGLLGPNGSGKSTTIKLMLGLIFPTAGSASILGQPAGSTAINEQIGFLPEESYLYRFLNGEETLHFYGRLFKIPRQRAEDAACPMLLDTVGLDAKAASASSANIPRAWPAASAWPRR